MRRLNILCGPTAVGKSAVGLHLAAALGAEILSVDSMKIYRGLDIGTGKSTLEERRRIRHHLIDIRDPWESYSVSQFNADVEGILVDCAARGVPLLGEGGTALYLKTLSEGLFDGPGKDVAIRSALEAEAEARGVGPLYERLQRIDPRAAARILPGDQRRIIRALEVHSLTGKTISSLQSQWGTPRADLDVRLACLTQEPRERLYARIDARIDGMLAAGWLDECRRLMALEKPLREAGQAIGYRTLFAHLRGEMKLEDAVQRTKFDTHHFARHQLKWYRKLPKLVFVHTRDDETPGEIAERVRAAWDAAGTAGANSQS